MKRIYSYVTDNPRKVRWTNDPVNGVSRESNAPRTFARVAFAEGDRNYYRGIWPSCHSRPAEKAREPIMAEYYRLRDDEALHEAEALAAVTTMTMQWLAEDVKPKRIYSYVTDTGQKIRFTNDPVNGVSRESNAPRTFAKVAYGCGCRDCMASGDGDLSKSCHSLAAGCGYTDAEVIRWLAE